MNPVSAVIVLVGAGIAVLAGVGVLRFETSYARFHAAGKASPVAFLVAAGAAAIETGWHGSVQLAVASAAMVLTIPVAVHLLFRAVHRTAEDDHLHRDDLRRAERAAEPRPDA